MTITQGSDGAQTTPTRDVTDERPYRRYVIRLLVLSLVLQTVAIAAPELQFPEGLLMERACALLSWLITLVSAVFLVCNGKRGNLWFVLAVVVALAGTVMGVLIYMYLNLREMDFYINHFKASSRYGYNEFEKVGFPYCLFIYGIACLLEFGSVVLMFKCDHDEGKRSEEQTTAKGLLN